MSIAITGVHILNAIREEQALKNPIRRWWHEQGGNPTHEYLECPLGRLRLGGFLSEDEYEAGVTWRMIYANWLKAIEAPADLDDEKAYIYEQTFKVGKIALMKLGRRVFDSVNAIVVYEEPEELGGFYFNARNARKGLRVLAEIF